MKSPGNDHHGNVVRLTVLAELLEPRVKGYVCSDDEHTDVEAFTT